MFSKQKNFKKVSLIFLTFGLGLSLQSCNDFQKDLDKEIGAFEIAAEQRELAKTNEAGYPVLDAGRGNPNWINSEARYAFSRLMNFAISECERSIDSGSMAGQGTKEGIGNRFDETMDENDPIDKFLIDSVSYCVNDLKMNKEDLLFEFSNGIIGDYYPSPSRCLEFSEKIMNEFLESILYKGVHLSDKTDLFPTEGGSAAMSYIFHSLNHNKLLLPGDKIAIGTPIFTPYLQIPDVNNYGLVSINVSSSEENDWDIPETEINKLKDKSIKALFLVNPSNPASHSLSDDTISRLEKVIEVNPNLIILTDDVYGSFVNNFQSVYARIPYNTILVYSYSKLYGVTGWRTGLIAMNKNNVMDKLLKELPKNKKDQLNREYSIVTTEPENMKFIDRVTADSRSVGLYHTSGLSTPSQIFMDILSLTHLIRKDNDPYLKQCNDLLTERYETLMNEFELEVDDVTKNAKYYSVININTIIRNTYGEGLLNWKKENKTDLDFLYDLAKKVGVVLMYGPGFETLEGYVRVSLANLNSEDYKEIARRIYEVLDYYYSLSRA